MHSAAPHLGSYHRRGDDHRRVDRRLDVARLHLLRQLRLGHAHTPACSRQTHVEVCSLTAASHIRQPPPELSWPRPHTSALSQRHVIFCFLTIIVLAWDGDQGAPVFRCRERPGRACAGRRRRSAVAGPGGARGRTTPSSAVAGEAEPQQRQVVLLVRSCLLTFAVVVALLGGCAQADRQKQRQQGRVARACGCGRPCARRPPARSCNRGRRQESATGYSWLPPRNRNAELQGGERTGR